MCAGFAKGPIAPANAIIGFELMDPNNKSRLSLLRNKWRDPRWKHSRGAGFRNLGPVNETFTYSTNVLFPNLPNSFEKMDYRVYSSLSMLIVNFQINENASR